MAKDIKFGNDSRSRIAGGVKKLADAHHGIDNLVRLIAHFYFLQVVVIRIRIDGLENNSSVCTTTASHG